MMIGENEEKMVAPFGQGLGLFFYLSDCMLFWILTFLVGRWGRVGLGWWTSGLQCLDLNGGLQWWTSMMDFNDGLQWWNSMVDFNGGLQWWTSMVDFSLWTLT
jgi:hypothetical protein